MGLDNQNTSPEEPPIPQGYQTKQGVAFQEIKLPQDQQITKKEVNSTLGIIQDVLMRMYEKIRTHAIYVGKNVKRHPPRLQAEIEALASALYALLGRVDSIAKTRTINSWGQPNLILSKLMPGHKTLTDADCVHRQEQMMMHLVMSYVLDEPDSNHGNLLFNGSSSVRIDLGEALSGLLDLSQYYVPPKSGIVWYPGKPFRTKKYYPITSLDLARLPNYLYAQPFNLFAYTKKARRDYEASGRVILNEMNAKYNKIAHQYFLKALLFDRKKLAPTVHALISTPEDEKEVSDYLEKRLRDLKRALMQVPKFRENIGDDAIYAEYENNIVAELGAYNQIYDAKLAKEKPADKKAQYRARLIDRAPVIRSKLQALRMLAQQCEYVAQSKAIASAPADLKPALEIAQAQVQKALRVNIKAQNKFHQYALQMALTEGEAFTEQALLSLQLEQLMIKLDYFKDPDAEGHHPFIDNFLTQFKANIFWQQKIKSSYYKPDGHLAEQVFAVNQSVDQCLSEQDDAFAQAQASKTSSNYDLLGGFSNALDSRKKAANGSLLYDMQEFHQNLAVFDQDCYEKNRGYKKKIDFENGRLAMTLNHKQINLVDKISTKTVHVIREGRETEALASGLYEALGTIESVAKTRFIPQPPPKKDFIVSKSPKGTQLRHIEARDCTATQTNLTLHLVMQYLLEDPFLNNDHLIIDRVTRKTVRIGLSGCFSDYSKRIDHMRTHFNFNQNQVFYDSVSIRYGKAFPITPIGLAEFPNYIIEKPLTVLAYDKNSSKLFQMSQSPEFNKAAHKYFLKALLFDKSRLAPIVHAFINTEVEEKNLNEHLAARMRALKRSLVQVPKFRKNVMAHFDAYQSEIIAEFEDYNDQFRKNYNNKSRLEKFQRRASIIDIEKVKVDLEKLRQIICLCDYVAQPDLNNPPLAQDLTGLFAKAQAQFQQILGIAFAPESPFHQYVVQMLWAQGDKLNVDGLFIYIEKQIEIKAKHIKARELTEDLTPLVKRIKDLNLPKVKELEALFYINHTNDQYFMKENNYRFDDTVCEKLTQGWIKALPPEYHAAGNNFSPKNFEDHKAIWSLCTKLLLRTPVLELMSEIRYTREAPDSEGEYLFWIRHSETCALSEKIVNQLGAHDAKVTLRRLNLLLQRCVDYSKKIKVGTRFKAGEPELAVLFLNKINQLYTKLLEGITKKELIEVIGGNLIAELEECAIPLKLKAHHGILGVLQSVANFIISLCTGCLVTDFVSFKTHRRELLEDVMKTGQECLLLKVPDRNTPTLAS